MVQVEEIKLSRVKTNKDNPRTITRDKFDKLVNSILVFPKMLQLRPIVVDGKMTALGGNMRNEALRAIAKMRPEEVAERLARIADFVRKTKGERDALVEYWGQWLENPTAYIVKADNLSEQEREQFIVKDNVSFGTWNYDALSSKWDSSLLSDWGMDVWQAAPAAFQPTVTGDGYVPSAPDESEVDGGINLSEVEDDFNEEEAGKAEPRVKSGEIWQLGEHRLMCVDCTYRDMLNKLTMGGGKMIDLYITDPPYNVDYTGKTADRLTIKNDKMDDSSFLRFLMEAFGAVDQVLRDGASFYVWHADSEGYNFRKAVRDTGWLTKQCLIWNKNAMVIGRQDYQWKHEPCLYGWKAGKSHHWYGDRRQTTVMDYDKPSRNGEHPTMKPIGLFAYLINNSTKEGDSVLDTFGGSGTTLIACEQLRRKCYMMELDPHYCDVIIARWEKLTGKEACKVT